MWRRRPLLTESLHLSHRYFNQSAAAEVPYDPEVPLAYLDGFPKPDPKYAEIIKAIPRANSGKNIAAKERKSGRVPSIVFEQKDGQHGGNKRLISVQNNQIKKLVNHLGRSFFLSRLFDLEVQSAFGSDDIFEKVRVLPRGTPTAGHPSSINNYFLIGTPSEDDQSADPSCQAVPPPTNTTSCRSIRVTAPPACSCDYYHYLALASMYGPNSCKEVSSNPHWQQAMTEEIHSLKKNYTWDLVDLLPGMSIAGSKWVY